MTIASARASCASRMIAVALPARGQRIERISARPPSIRRASFMLRFEASSSEWSGKSIG